MLARLPSIVLAGLAGLLLVPSARADAADSPKVDLVLAPGLRDAALIEDVIVSVNADVPIGLHTAMANAVPDATVLSKPDTYASVSNVIRGDNVQCGNAIDENLAASGQHALWGDNILWRDNVVSSQGLGGIF